MSDYYRRQSDRGTNGIVMLVGMIGWFFMLWLFVKLVKWTWLLLVWMWE